MIRWELWIDIWYDWDLNFKYNWENIIVLRSTFDQLTDRVEFKKYISEIKELTSKKTRVGIEARKDDPRVSMKVIDSNECKKCDTLRDKGLSSNATLSEKLNVIAMHKYWEYLSDDTIVTIFDKLTEDDIVKDWLRDSKEAQINKRFTLKEYMRVKREETDKNLTELLTGIKNLFS